MNNEKTVLSILAALKLVEGFQYNRSVVEDAARRVLSDSKYSLGEYVGVPLKSILGSINNNNIVRYHSPQKTNLQSSFFKLYDKKPNVIEYTTELIKELKNCSDSDEKLLWALECYGSCLGVDEKHDSVSLFEFVKLTAAFVNCSLKSKNVRIVGANISGIQRYLYEIASKNAAKLLKGRSFYLQLLGDSILNEFLDRLGVNQCHVIYSSGGGFHILVPDYVGIESDFQTITSEVSNNIYKFHKTNLFVETAMSEAFNGVNDLGKVWDNVFLTLRNRRNNRLSWNETLRSDFFGFVESGGIIIRDPITNEEITDGSGENYNGMVLQDITKQQIELGKNIREANFWYRTKIKSGNNYLKDPFGFYHYFENEKVKFADATICTFNNFDGAESTLLYGGNKFPMFSTGDKNIISELNANLRDVQEPYRIGDVKPFDILARGEKLDRLAVLRMDVDDLGSVFSLGFDNMCTYSSVSRTLDLFFKGYINTIWEKYQSSTQIIYSGGDDLFVVGKWNDVFSFAREINAQFKEWSCGTLTLSGGMVLLPPKFPIMQGAKLAEIAEKNAKAHKVGDEIKNSITFLEMPLNWDTELPIVEELFLMIYSLLSQRKLSMNFITKISQYSEARQSYLQTKNPPKGGDYLKPNPSWIWTMLYDFSRYKEQQARGNIAKKFVADVMSSVLSNTFNGYRFGDKRHFLDMINTACRWAELEKRTENDIQ